MACEEGCVTIMLDKLIPKGYHIYSDSVSCSEETQCAIVRKNKIKYLAIKGAKSHLFEGEFDGTVLICALSGKKVQILHELFPYTKPYRLPPVGISIGLGDRFGLSIPGHTRAIKGKPVYSVFAQQSIRELNLTNRTFMDVVSAATYGVFEVGYKGGYAADGDQLKLIKEIEYALSAGCTLITLDCSEYIYERYLGADKKL